MNISRQLVMAVRGSISSKRQVRALVSLHLGQKNNRIIAACFKPWTSLNRHMSDIVTGTEEAAKLTIDGMTVLDDEDDEEMVEMFIQGPGGMEWGGPSRGGKYPEPTRYGDWEQKGRVSDF